MLSPWQMDYWLNKPATENAIGIGAVLIMFNLISVNRLIDKGEEILNILLGFWIILSPFTLNFQDQKAMMLNMILVGSLIVILAVWQIYDAVK